MNDSFESPTYTLPISSVDGGNKQPNNTVKYLLIGCGALLLLTVCACIVLAGGAYFLAENSDIPNMTASLEMPNVVTVGEQFDLHLTITNNGSTAVYVGDIDLDSLLESSILDGAVVISTDPAMDKDYATDGIKSFLYNDSIPANSSVTVSFTLEATSVGSHGGSITIYDDGIGSYTVENVSLEVTP